MTRTLETSVSSHRLWGGRFSSTDVPQVMTDFNASIAFDKRLYRADIRCSQAYARALCAKGILTAQEEAQLTAGLEAVLGEWESGKLVIAPGDEDVHTANERRLKELVGPVAGKLHTGRSRNDQVATDMRYWLHGQVVKILAHLRELIAVAVDRAEREIDVLMAGYTHLQRAQPIRWSHLLLSYVASWKADADRLVQFLERLNVSPLGSGALAGNPFGVDRQALARDLGFAGITSNSLHGVGDRDFVAEFLFWASLLMTHLSRFAEDMIVYSTAEFGFVVLADAYSTGSSLMPQKKNADSLELIRGKCGRVFGSMSGFMMTLKGLPSTYNKDMQEDKEPLFDTVDTVSGCLQIALGVLDTLTIHPDRMLASLSADMLATDLAEYLVRKGLPFREAHNISGAAVMLAEARSCPLSSLPVEDLKSLHPIFEVDVASVWDFERSVENRCSEGGTSRASVVAQIADIRRWLANN